MQNDLRIPDIEVIVNCSSYDVGFFAFYQRLDIHQGYEIVCGVTRKDAIPVVRQILQDAITSLGATDWVTMDELGASEDEKTDEPPF